MPDGVAIMGRVVRVSVRGGVNGVTLLEVMIALVILSLVAVAYLQLVAGATRSTTRAEEWSQAVAYAEEVIERYKVEGTAPDASSPERLEGDFTRWVERRGWGDGLVWVTAVVTLPGGARFELDRLTPAQP